MRYRGVDGGTPTGEPLCRSCTMATHIKGRQLGQEIIYCGMLHQRMPFEAVECGAYNDRNDDGAGDMYSIAWYYEVVDRLGNRSFVPKAIYERMERGEKLTPKEIAAATATAAAR